MEKVVQQFFIWKRLCATLSAGDRNVDFQTIWCMFSKEGGRPYRPRLFNLSRSAPGILENATVLRKTDNLLICAGSSALGDTPSGQLLQSSQSFIDFI